MPRFSVTQEHIDAAKPKESGHCMIADAIKAKLPDVSHVVVDLQSIRYTDRRKGRRLTFWTPLLAQRMLLAFDNGGEFDLGGEVVRLAPFDFNIGRVIVEHEARSTAVRKDRKRVLKTKGKPGERGPTQRGGKPLPRAQLSSDPRAAQRIDVKVGRRREFGLCLMGR